MNPFDAIDRQIIEILQLDGRISMTDLAAQVHLSQPATSTRLRRLEVSGVVAGYTARVAAAKLGLTTHAVIRLATTHPQIVAALERFATIPEVNRIYRVTGGDCFVLDVWAADAARLEEVIDAIGRFGQVTTALVLREYPGHPMTPGM